MIPIALSTKPPYHCVDKFVTNDPKLVTSESVSLSLKRAKSCPFWAYLAPTEMPVSIKLVTSWRFTLMLNLQEDETKMVVLVHTTVMRNQCK